MVIAMDPPGSTYEYVIKSDRKRDPADQTKFIIKVLDDVTQARLQDSGSTMNVKTNQLKISPGKKSLEIIREGLVDIQNFKDRNGEFIFIDKDKQGKLASSILSRIPQRVRIELANEITDNLSLTEEEEKNSESEQDLELDT